MPPTLAERLGFAASERVAVVHADDIGMCHAANEGAFNTDLLDEFSSDAARDGALVSSMLILGRSDPELARRLIETRISDSRARAQAERQLALGGQLPAGFIGQLPAGVVIR